MKKQRHLPDGLKNTLLLLIPLFYLAAGLYFRLILDDPSLRSVDPDYVYFCTGLNMAEGHFKVAHIDHPGTPLQVITALVFRLVWWFRGEGGGFTGDFGDLGDIFSSFFGGGFGGGGRRANPNAPRRGNDTAAAVNLSFEEAAKGCRKTVKVTKIENCKECGGTGNDPVKIIQAVGAAV